MRAAGVRPTIRDGRLVIDRPDALDADLLREVLRNEAAIVEFVLAARARYAVGAHDDRAAGTVPLTSAQGGLLFMDRLFEGSGLFNIVTEIEIRGALDLPALLRALRHVLKCHPILTARVADCDGTVNWIDGRWVLRDVVSIVDAGGALSAAEGERLCRQLADRERRRVFTGTGGWLRVTVVRIAADSWVLLMCRHHIASDGWSFAIMSQQIQDAYGRYRRGLEPEPTDPQQFWHYCRFMEHKSRDAAGMKYWLSQLAGAPREIRLPRTGAITPRVSSAKFVRIVVPRAHLTALTPYKITSFAYLLAVFALVLFKESRQNEFCIGTDVTTRDRPDWERVVGMFVNRLVLRIAVDDRVTVLDFLIAVQKVVSGALEWRHTSLDRLIRRLGMNGEGGLFNVIFGLHNNPHHAFRLDHSVHCRMREVRLLASEVDLSLYFTSTRSIFNGVLAYRDECFAADWVQRFANQYCSLAAAIAGGLQASLSKLALLDADQDSESLAKQWQALYTQGGALSFGDNHDE